MDSSIRDFVTPEERLNFDGLSKHATALFTAAVVGLLGILYLTQCFINVAH